MKKSYEIVRYGLNGLTFMKVHERLYDFVRYSRFGLFFMNFHEKIVQNRTKQSRRLTFMKIHERFVRFRTKLLRPNVGPTTGLLCTAFFASFTRLKIQFSILDGIKWTN